MIPGILIGLFFGFGLGAWFVCFVDRNSADDKPPQRINSHHPGGK